MKLPLHCRNRPLLLPHRRPTARCRRRAGSPAPRRRRPPSQTRSWGRSSCASTPRPTSPAPPPPRLRAPVPPPLPLPPLPARPRISRYIQARRIPPSHRPIHPRRAAPQLRPGGPRARGRRRLHLLLPPRPLPVAPPPRPRWACRPLPTPARRIRIRRLRGLRPLAPPVRLDSPHPNDLTASMPQPGCMIKSFNLFLAPPDEDGEDDKLEEDEEVSSFRVICSVPFEFENKLMAFVFSSVNQKWQVATHHRLRSSISLCFYAHGCFFWLVILTGYALMLDTREMKFSTIDLPPNDGKEARAIVDAGEGRLGLLTFGEGTIDLSCKVWQNNGVGAEEWQHYKIIHLPKDSDGNNYDWYIMGAAEGYLSLMARQRDNYELPLQYFALDLKTFLFERLCAVNEFTPHHLYASLPPPLAPPSL